MMILLRCVAVAALVVSAGAAAASPRMNAEEFYRRATALKSKGPMALLHGSEIKLLTREGEAAGMAARQARLKAEAAGGRGRYCPPPGDTKMGSSEFLSRLGAIPAAERRRIDMGEATLRILAAKYPCR